MFIAAYPSVISFIPRYKEDFTNDNENKRNKKKKKNATLYAQYNSLAYIMIGWRVHCTFINILCGEPTKCIYKWGVYVYLFAF